MSYLLAAVNAFQHDDFPNQIPNGNKVDQADRIYKVPIEYDDVGIFDYKQNN